MRDSDCSICSGDCAPEEAYVLTDYFTRVATTFGDNPDVFMRNGRPCIFPAQQLISTATGIHRPYCQFISKITDTPMRFAQELAGNIQPEPCVAFWG